MDVARDIWSLAKNREAMDSARSLKESRIRISFTTVYFDPEGLLFTDEEGATHDCNFARDDTTDTLVLEYDDCHVKMTMPNLDELADIFVGPLNRPIDWGPEYDHARAKTTILMMRPVDGKWNVLFERNSVLHTWTDVKPVIDATEYLLELWSRITVHDDT